MKSLYLRAGWLLPLLLLAACASKPRVHQLSNAEYGESIRLRKGEILEIQVYSRPASAMQWQREGEGSPVLIELESSFQSLHPGQSNAGGVLTLRLRATKRGREVLRYVYRLPAPSDAAPGDRVDVVVNVK